MLARQELTFQRIEPDPIFPFPQKPITGEASENFCKHGIRSPKEKIRSHASIANIKFCTANT